MIPANASARKGPEGKYPLHYLVWHNRHRELEKEVRAGQVGAPSGTTARHARASWGRGAAPPVPPPRRVCSASLFAAAAFVLVDLKRVMGAALPAFLVSGPVAHTCSGPTRVPGPPRLVWRGPVLSSVGPLIKGLQEGVVGSVCAPCGARVRLTRSRRDILE